MPDLLDTMLRNQWIPWAGIGGYFALDFAIINIFKRRNNKKQGAKRV